TWSAHLSGCVHFSRGTRFYGRHWIGRLRRKGAKHACSQPPLSLVRLPKPRTQRLKSGPCGCWAPPRSFSFVHSRFQETAMSTPAIKIQGVRKAFQRREREAGAPWWRRENKDKVALHELDLTVGAGGITGILGPNGSGKSTLIRILGTLLTPDAGTALVFGWDVVTQPLQVRRHVNRVSVEAAFFKEL